jgi:hypothetical protein
MNSNNIFRIRFHNFTQRKSGCLQHWKIDHKVFVV